MPIVRGNQGIQAVLGCSHKEATLKQRSAISTRGILDIVDHQHGRARMGAGVGRSAASGSSRARSDCGISCTWVPLCGAPAASLAASGELPFTSRAASNTWTTSCNRFIVPSRNEAQAVALVPKAHQSAFRVEMVDTPRSLRQLIGCGKL